MRIGTRLALAALPLGAALFFPAAALFLPAAATAWAWPRLPDPGDPFTMSVDDVACRSGRAAVTLRNQTRQAVRFDLQADAVSVASGSIPARKSVVRQVPVGRGGTAEIEAYQVSDQHPDTLIDSTRVRNDCPWGHRHGRLPYTGPPADLMAKLATAGGLVVTGGILWWYGSVWPRQDGPHPSPATKAPAFAAARARRTDRSAVSAVTGSRVTTSR
ncbi:hypothetical protein MF672_048855 [Actinomadura sp. ATCC 31491]|uniref:Uncharacterized protein n=1 Tax=Actinomadura luzonensis TaxID=2805427 RepID=A0ABT0GAN3_9ACTN|nr:hypothetical protein [Actinomadura luzonensis]MCK2221665.1 hypothetical protein [Actinomadura luzonensis]